MGWFEAGQLEDLFHRVLLPKDVEDHSGSVQGLVFGVN
jgi:hypothetical protein